MRVLNIEDDSFKHNDICKVLSHWGITSIDWSTNLSEGWEKIQESIACNSPYDLIVTDMYYAEEPGGSETASGEILIERVLEHKIAIPVILCSSVNLKFPEIYGCVYYNKAKNWEDDMRRLVNNITKKDE